MIQKAVILVILIVCSSTSCFAQSTNPVPLWKRCVRGLAKGLQATSNTYSNIYGYQNPYAPSTYGSVLPSTTLNPYSNLQSNQIAMPSLQTGYTTPRIGNLGGFNSNLSNLGSTMPSYTVPSYGSGYAGQLTVNKFAPNAVSPYASQSRLDSYSMGGPKLYDSLGNYHGNLNGNKYDPDSVSNPYGRYGSKYSSDSINNKYGVGSPYNDDSPFNPYGQGMKLIAP